MIVRRRFCGRPVGCHFPRPGAPPEATYIVALRRSTSLVLACAFGLGTRLALADPSQPVSQAASAPPGARSTSSDSASLAQEPPLQAFTLRVVAERTYGQWKRDYDGKFSAPGAVAEFGIRVPETLEGWRGRVFLGQASRDSVVTGGVSFSLEVMDEIRHEIPIAGLTHTFMTQPWILAGAGRLEFQFLKRGATIGLELGAGTVNESIGTQDPNLTVTPLSGRFSLTGAVGAGYRFVVVRPLVFGLLASSEYHTFTNSFRLGLGISLEVDRTR